MEERSRIYENTAYRLMMDNFYNQSVVCYYYSVLQWMMYILAERVAVPVSYANQAPMGEDKHNWLCQEIKDRISSPNYRSQFSEAFEKLRGCRHEADYEARRFTKEECVEVRELALRVKSLIRYAR